MNFDAVVRPAGDYLARVQRLQERYRAGEVHARVPDSFCAVNRPLDELSAQCFPASHRLLDEACQALFYSLPLAFDPGESVGPYLATIDKDPATGEPWRFLDMGALIATHGFGENDPTVIAAVLEHLPYVVSRYAHSEYQTALSLKMKAALARIAPRGTPRFFMVNTGAEAVENAIKSVLLNRVRTCGAETGTFIVSFEGAFHGRTLGSLAVTHRKKARLGFPTFDWPHAIFPWDDPRNPNETVEREERSLRQVHDLIVGGPRAKKSPDPAWKRLLGEIDEALAKHRDAKSMLAWVDRQRSSIAPDVWKRARRAAGVLIEPVQGEGGVRHGTPRFYRRLRLLTKVLDVPLMFDEVQAGWGTCGTLWAHELFDLPLPPDVVVWAKKAQNGVLFVSDELATFFQEEKKFNTTWEGDSVGMVRLLSILDRLDLDQVRRTSERAREGLESLERDFGEFIQSVRGAGVMLAFDVARPDWRDVLRDRVFRHGLILLPAGERALRFYPRYDTEPYAIDEAVAILRRSIEEVLGGRARSDATLGPELRVGTLDVPLASIEVLDLTPETFPTLRADVMAVEIERYGAVSQYPADVLKSGPRPLLQYEPETLESTIGNVRSAGVALRDKVSRRIVAYALGSPVEHHDEEGVSSDPHRGDNNAFYLQAMATLPTVRNQAEVERYLLDVLRGKVEKLGYEHLSALIEERTLATGPAWLQKAAVLRRIKNYLRSGIKFVYLQAALGPSAATTRTT